MTYRCAWTDEEFDGKGYVLTTTEGQEVVSADALMFSDAMGKLWDIVQHLADRLEAVEVQLSDGPTDQDQDQEEGGGGE